MTTKIKRRSPKALRLAIATLLVVPAVVASMNPSAASPSKADVEAAKQKVAQLQDQFSALSENYNEALYQVQQAQQHLAEAKAMRDAAQEQADEARSRLTARAVQTYTDMGSQYEALLSSDSLTQFSDRLEFLGALTQSDSTLASEADSATQRAAWATQEYDRAVADAQAKANAAQQERQKAEQALQDMEALAADLDQQYQQALAAQQQALAAQQQATAPTQPPTDSSTSGGGGFVPPPNAGAAGIAVQAAYSALGAPYVFGAAGPSSFDCSGLTSWAWAQAGVYLPHSASAQWNTLPRGAARARSSRATSSTTPTSAPTSPSTWAAATSSTLATRVPAARYRSAPCTGTTTRTAPSAPGRPDYASGVQPVPSDAELIERLRARDEAAFMELVDRLSPSMRRVARMFVSTDAVADECVQEAWLGVLQGIDGFQGRSSLRTWIFRILVNIAKTRGQREGRSVPFATLAGDDLDRPTWDPSAFDAPVRGPPCRSIGAVCPRIGWKATRRSP